MVNSIDTQAGWISLLRQALYHQSSAIDAWKKYLFLENASLIISQTEVPHVYDDMRNNKP